jgi:hypothetical protein
MTVLATRDAPAWLDPHIVFNGAHFIVADGSTVRFVNEDGVITATTDVPQMFVNDLAAAHGVVVAGTDEGGFAALRFIGSAATNRIRVGPR